MRYIGLAVSFILVLFILGLYMGQGYAKKNVSFDKPSAEEKKLHALINRYRTSRGLPAVGLSKSLTYVARAHVRDLNSHSRKKGCNMHSWSSHGSWTACCYTSNHARASCMWNKPEELTNYPGNGFECSHWTSATAGPGEALSGWKRSRGHNAVIISKGMWKSHPWKSMGVGIYGHYAVVWFGEQTDPDGYWKEAEGR